MWKTQMRSMSTSTDSSNNVTPKSTKKLPFTSLERELIITLVRERPIIEDKRTNAKNNELKKQAWNELAVAYNAQPYVYPRNSNQLKRCWENIKTQKKKELSKELSAYKRGTGGGSTAYTDNVVDIICPVIDLKVPGDNDSNSVENTGFAEIKVNKKRKPYCDSQEDNNKHSNEIELRIKRCNVNIEQEQALHELRMERERILIEREKNMLQFEKEMHALQLKKLKLEINILNTQK